LSFILCKFLMIKKIKKNRKNKFLYIISFELLERFYINYSNIYCAIIAVPLKLKSQLKLWLMLGFGPRNSDNRKD